MWTTLFVNVATGMRRRGGLRHPARLKATAVFNQRSRDGGPLDRNNVRFFVG